MILLPQEDWGGGGERDHILFEHVCVSVCEREFERERPRKKVSERASKNVRARLVWKGERIIMGWRRIVGSMKL